jgi:hypothetical protein
MSHHKNEANKQSTLKEAKNMTHTVSTQIPGFELITIGSTGNITITTAGLAPVTQYPLIPPVNVNGALTKIAAMLLFLDALEDQEGYYRPFLNYNFGEKAVKLALTRGLVDREMCDCDSGKIYFITPAGRDWLDANINTILRLIDAKYFMPDSVEDMAAKVIMANLLDRAIETHPDKALQAV